MRPVRLLPAASAATALAVLVASAGGATAADTPAAGQVASVLSVLQLQAGDTVVEAGVVELLAETLAAPVSQVVVTPLQVGETAYGRQTVEGRSVTVPAVSTASVAPALAGLLSVAGPAVDAGAATTADSATSRAASGDLGSLSLLGLPIRLDGAVTALSTSGASGALGEQSVVVEDLALPSVADLLAALGLDLSALPVEVLYELLDQLDLVTTTVDTLKGELDAAKALIQAQIDAAQAGVEDALAEVEGLTTQVAGKESQLNTASATLAAELAKIQPLVDARDDAQDAVDAANAQLTAAQQQLSAAIAAAQAALDTLLGPLAPTVTESNFALIGQLSSALKSGITAAQTAVSSADAAVAQATAALTAATTALAAAQDLADAAQAAVDLLEGELAALNALLDTAQQLLDDAYALLEQVLSAVTAEIDALLGAVTAVLDGTPLVRLASLEVLTRTVVDSAAPGGQRAEVIGGEVTGLEVLGTDVLSDVLGSTSVDLLQLTTEQLGLVNGLVGTLTGTLSEVLSTVPLFPELSIPAPVVEVLVTEESTDVVDGFGVAAALVQLLRIELPAIELPLDLALPGAADLPVFDVADLSAMSAHEVLLGQDLVLGIGQLGPAARFRPAATGPTTQTPGPQTPGTQAPGGTPTVTPVASPRPLPATGAPALVAVAGLVLLGGAALARRRRAVDPLDADELL